MRTAHLETLTSQLPQSGIFPDASRIASVVITLNSENAKDIKARVRFAKPKKESMTTSSSSSSACDMAKLVMNDVSLASCSEFTAFSAADVKLVETEKELERVGWNPILVTAAVPMRLCSDAVHRPTKKRDVMRKEFDVMLRQRIGALKTATLALRTSVGEGDDTRTPKTQLKVLSHTSAISDTAPQFGESEVSLSSSVRGGDGTLTSSSSSSSSSSVAGGASVTFLEKFALFGSTSVTSGSSNRRGSKASSCSSSWSLLGTTTLACYVHPKDSVQYMHALLMLDFMRIAKLKFETLLCADLPGVEDFRISRDIPSDARKDDDNDDGATSTTATGVPSPKHTPLRVSAPARLLFRVPHSDSKSFVVSAIALYEGEAIDDVLSDEDVGSARKSLEECFALDASTTFDDKAICVEDTLVHIKASSYRSASSPLSSDSASSSRSQRTQHKKKRTGTDTDDGIHSKHQLGSSSSILVLLIGLAVAVLAFALFFFPTTSSSPQMITSPPPPPTDAPGIHDEIEAVLDL